MVDAGENISVTLKREFSEEALNALEATEEERKRIEASIADLFRHGREVWKADLFRHDPPSGMAAEPSSIPGVTGPDNDQDQTTTTLFGRCVVLKFQDQTMTS